ncbi:minor tail protein [Streptomyces phage BRock]|uniref:Collagen triple helix repeat-containing protein n=1 Tax=Streptomyces phage BRock TaxID=1913591 RepID=A0A1J0GW76_9CAUD|nr:minor tail protein [Streptomyces phage BRock]APC46441.1 collagen triple helix repeat-containing protein [Streptomyces phage BRock]
MTFTPIAPGTTNWDVPLNGALTTQDNSLASAQGDIAGLQSSVAALQTSVAALNGIVTGATFYRLVAASDASAEVKAKADYVCDGAGDQVEIQAAINAAQLEGGGAIQLSEGTFNIASPLVINGTLTETNPRTIILNGCGQYATMIVPTINVNGIALSDWAQCTISNLGIQINGSGSGIVATGVTSGTTRSFWNSSFTNIRVTGSYVTTNTGWGMNLEMPYRSTFDNIEIEGTRNGIKLVNTNSSTTSGYSSFERIRIDLVGTNGVGIHLRSDSGNLSRNTFNLMDMRAASTGCTGILVDGAANSRSHRFWAADIDQFSIAVAATSCESTVFDINYLAGDVNQAGNKGFVAGAASFNNVFSARKVLIGTADALSVFEDNGTTADSPNIFERIRIENSAGGTVTYSRQPHTVQRDIVTGNLGNPLPAGLLQYPTSGYNNPEFRASDHGLISWTTDTVTASNTSITQAGIPIYTKIKLTERVNLITNILVVITTAGATLTANQNFAGIYDSSGTRLGVTADQSGTWNSTGLKTMALTAPLTLGPGYYYIALLTNGTTQPTFLAAGATAQGVGINANLTVATARALSGPAGGVTSLPASVTLGSQVLTGAVRWSGLT